MSPNQAITQQVEPQARCRDVISHREEVEKEDKPSRLTTACQMGTPKLLLALVLAFT